MSRSLRAEIPPTIPSISCYHAEVHVQRGEEIVTLLVDLPDWAPEEEVVGDLAGHYKAATMGEIVEALEGEGRVRVEPVPASSFYCQGDRRWWHMGDRVG